MAGQLPGVECARRRRFHQSGVGTELPSAVALGMTRRSIFCLYTTNYQDSHLSSSSSSSLNLQLKNQTYISLRFKCEWQKQHRNNSHAYQVEKLGGVAGEAKDRLDERLRAQWKPETKRNVRSQQSTRSTIERRTVESRDLQIEVFGAKKSTTASKRFNWSKLGWKARDQVECAICLETFKNGEPLVNLPCAHRFHSRCLVPWLETNAHCPCCRMAILN
ncbi:hypothetical protein RHMOL_Rhmol01G0042500 [Rhododendron molle]|uniref:Uncharacterized protein n=1 Tax=Rhododendron molle TaxID=49168 RepID=A0ACC0PZU9_RHOML|nr:hypothetical protein RHMOL_Rhmol01G0042500 [Rhododendron molle]